MGTVLQQTDYQCEQCGATNIVAAPVVYSQGTHSLFGPVSRRNNAVIFSTQLAAPPRPEVICVHFSVGDSQAFILFLWPLLASEQFSHTRSHAALRPQTVALLPIYWNVFASLAMFQSFTQGRSLQSRSLSSACIGIGSTHTSASDAADSR